MSAFPKTVVKTKAGNTVPDLKCKNKRKIKVMFAPILSVAKRIRIIYSRPETASLVLSEI